MSSRYDTKIVKEDQYANSLIESLSKSLVKELENSNKNFTWEKALNTSNSVNTLCDILNRNHCIGSMPPLPILKKDNSSHSESSISSSNSHIFMPKLNLQNKTQNKAFGEFTSNKNNLDINMIEPLPNFSKKIKIDTSNLSSHKLTDANQMLERNFSTLLLENTSKSGRVDYVALYNTLDAKNELLKLKRS